MEENISPFIRYISEWFDLAIAIIKNESIVPLTKFESSIKIVEDLPITRTTIDDLCKFFFLPHPRKYIFPNNYNKKIDQVISNICKKKLKKLWNSALSEQIWSVIEYWFRSFQDVTIKDQNEIIDSDSNLILKQSWEIILQNSKQQTLKSFSSLLYKKLFEIAPHLRTLFQNSLESQNEKLIKMISLLIQQIDDPNSFRITVENLGQRHRLYKVKTSNFSVFKDAWLFALENSLDDWTNEIRDSWISFYNIIEEIMKTQMKETEEIINDDQKIVEARIYSAIISETTELNLCNYKIASFPILEKLSQLQQLHLRNNNIIMIPEEINILKNLEILDLSKNKLKTISPQIGCLTQLKRFYLSFNLLKELPCEFGKLIHLTKLSVNNNKLKSLFPSIYSLRHLNTLDASNNKIKNIPWQIYLLDELKEINLTGNAVKFTNDIKTIKETIYTNYFQGESISNTLKFALLGCEGAGKTVSYKILSYFNQTLIISSLHF